MERTVPIREFDNQQRINIMNLISVEIFCIALIAVYVLVCAVFFAYPRREWSFADSFDRAFMWGCAIFAIGYGLDTVAYAAMA